MLLKKKKKAAVIAISFDLILAYLQTLYRGTITGLLCLALIMLVKAIALHGGSGKKKGVLQLYNVNTCMTNGQFH